MKPHMRHIKTFLMLIILALTSLIGRHEAIAGGLASKPVKKSREFVTPTEEQMETELDKKQKEEKWAIVAKTPHGKEAKTFENEAERIISLLRQEGVILYDWVVSLEAIDSFESLKIALRAYEGRSFAKIPDNKQILKQLKNLLSKIRKMNLTKDELKILSSNDLMNKIESIYSIGLEKQKKHVPVINFNKKWNNLKSKPDFDPDFYEHIYDALAKEEVVMNSEYPDESDQILNAYPKYLALLKRRYRLIIFLASIKDPSKPREISSEIVADRDERVPYSTSANSPSWFHDKRYKLYKIAEQLPAMTREDKSILLSSFLHAGQHCSVAKRFQIDQSYKRFANADALALETELAAKAQSLEESIELALGSSKERILDNLSRAALEREKERTKIVGEDRFGLREFDAEEVTFWDATYDAYAHNFGLKKRDCLYQTYKLNINTQEAFGNCGYRIKTILNDLKRELDNKVERELAGDLQHVLRDPDLLILGYLKQKNFIVEPGSSVEKATWTHHNDPVNDLRPEPVTASNYQAINLLQTPENQRSVSRRRTSRAPMPVPRSIVSMTERFGLTEVGRISQAILETIDQEVNHTLSSITQEHFQDLISNPISARDDNERLAALSAREILVLVDQSGSMMTPDKYPMLGRCESWNRWQSARLATENIVDLALSLDRDAQVDIMLWTSKRTGLNSTYNTVSHSSEVLPIFESNRPLGNTPLAEALNEVYENRLRQLLLNSQPFTCFILTDGAPNDPNRANEFFKRIILENNLQQAGRENLAAFSFIQIGEDHAAANYLQHLDDSFILQNGFNIDIIDVNQDDFFFGTGRYREQESVGPFAVFWNAIYE